MILQLKYEIRGEAQRIASDLFVQPLAGHRVQPSKIDVEQDLLSAYDENSAANFLRGHQFLK